MTPIKLIIKLVIPFSDLLRWNSSYDSKGRYIFRNDASCSYYGPFPDLNTMKNYCPGANPTSSPYHNFITFVAQASESSIPMSVLFCPDLNSGRKACIFSDFEAISGIENAFVAYNGSIFYNQFRMISDLGTIVDYSCSR